MDDTTLPGPSAPGAHSFTGPRTPPPPVLAPSHLGTVYLPGGQGTPVGGFEFLVDPDHGLNVEIGTPVAADTSEGTLVGTVIDMRTVGNDPDPVAAELAAGGSERIGTLPEVMVARVAVFDSPRLRPARSGRVRAATAAELRRACGADKIEWPIPAGVVTLADGSMCAIPFDGTALLGPESAHMLVGGLSGQAAKTSYIGVLLRAAIAAGSPQDHSVAALVFNVKGDDLLFVDEPVAGSRFELTTTDRDLYAALGVPPTPFEDVEVWAPSMGANLGSRSNRPDSRALSWDMATVWDSLRFIDEHLTTDDNTSGFLAQFRDRVVGPGADCDTFDKINRFFETEIEQAKERESQSCWGATHVATMHKLARRFRNMKARGQGLFIGGRCNPARDDIPASGWTHGRVCVVDLAGLPTEIQGFVIARTTDRMVRAAEHGELGVDHLVVFADELNAFAPAVGAEMGQVRRTLQRISTQGRYAGVSLVGAAQMISRVDELVRGNASTRVLGVTSDSELASGVYGRLAPGLAERIATLAKGQMVAWHYTFRQPMLIRFPRPAWRTGKPKTPGAGASRKDPTAVVRSHIGQGRFERLTEGVDDATVSELITSASSVSELEASLSERRAQDMSRSLHEPSSFDPDNPFDLS